MSQFLTNVLTTVKTEISSSNSSSNSALNTNHYLLCVHTRLGDFSYFGAQSKGNFTFLATRYVHSRLMDHSRF